MGVVLSPVVFTDVVILLINWEYGGSGESSIVLTGGVMVAASLAV